jgi:hypothetical protein
MAIKNPLWPEYKGRISHATRTLVLFGKWNKTEDKEVTCQTPYGLRTYECELGEDKSRAARVKAKESTSKRPTQLEHVAAMS